MVSPSLKFCQCLSPSNKRKTIIFSSTLSGKRLLLLCFFSSEMCLGMYHVMEVSSCCVLEKGHSVEGWGDVCFRWVVFLFGGVLCCVVLWLFSWDLRPKRR